MSKPKRQPKPGVNGPGRNGGPMTPNTKNLARILRQQGTRADRRGANR